MKPSKNLFFSEDEIEAVDMEIETLLLAKRRQESQEYVSTPATGLSPTQTHNEPPAVSRPSLDAAGPVITAPVVRNPTSALPPQRLQKADNREYPARFRMETGDESPIRWPKQETRDSQRRKYPAKRRYRIRLKWVFILAVATLLWISMIATGYAIWQSGNVLTLARFVFNLLLTRRGTVTSA